MISRLHTDLAGLRRYALYEDCLVHGNECPTPEVCSKYRYALDIQLTLEHHRLKRPEIVFLMLNPSTATHLKNDPTVAKCCRFARRWGHGAITVVNLFGYRSKDPTDLPLQADPIGPRNDDIIDERAWAARRVICAWGTGGDLLERGETVRRRLAPRGNLYHLRITKRHPWHPLYLPEDLEPTLWR